MQKIKYQVFISSTYSDLRLERDAITKSLYEMGCIPVGMEAFPAADEEQFNFIKRIIDDTDYYILLIGARYGSSDEDGIGFTEKEYNYALDKGIPILAFVHSDPNKIEEHKSDLGNATTAEKFYKFRNTVTESRLVKMWDNSATLPAFVVLALNTAFANKPRPGWSRGGMVNNEAILAQLVDAQTALHAAQEEVRQLQANREMTFDVADLSVSIEVEIETWRRNHQSSVLADIPIKVDVPLKKLFSVLGPNMIEPINQNSVSNILAIEASKGLRKADAVEYKFKLERESLNTIRLQLGALGLISVQRAQAVDKKMYNFWRLTDEGITEVQRLRVLRKPDVEDRSTES